MSYLFVYGPWVALLCGFAAPFVFGAKLGLGILAITIGVLWMQLDWFAASMSDRAVNILKDIIEPDIPAFLLIFFGLGLVIWRFAR